MVEVIAGNAQDYHVHGQIGSKTCCPFTRVLHTTHIGEAVTILRDKAIRPRPVYDSSTLRGTELQVVWVGPRTWYSYRYGGIQFQFDWLPLLGGRHAYWIEVALYNTHAPRILITDQDYNGRFIPYDPTQPTGPWWRNPADGLHYMNDDYCVEFMIEADVGLHDLAELQFVKHREDMCSLHPNQIGACRERTLSSVEAGARFIARVEWERLDAEPLRLATAQGGARVPSATLLDVWSRLRDWMWSWTDDDPNGPVGIASPTFRATNRALLAAVGRGFNNDARDLAGLFSTREDRIRGCRSRIAERFDVPEDTLPLEDPAP